MKMIDVSKVRVFRGSLFVLLMLFMRIGWASNDDSTYNIVDFGAKGDGITDNTQFINRTIEACSLRGGGTVIIPEGTFLTGSILHHSTGKKDWDFSCRELDKVAVFQLEVESLSCKECR